MENIIDFKEGIPGFEQYTKYMLMINEDEENPFHRLQCMEKEDVSFLVIDPFLIVPDYEFKLKDAVIDSLNLETEKDVAVFSIVKVPEKIEDMTINLSAPVIINHKTSLGKQVVLENENYSIRHRVYRGDAE